MKKNTIATLVGFLTVITHALVIVYIWFLKSGSVLSPPVAEALIADQILMPVTAGYAVSVVKWFVDNQNDAVQSEKVVNKGYSVLVFLLALGFNLSIVFGVLGIRYMPHLFGSMENINSYFVTVEVAFGGMYVWIFNDLFKSTEDP